MKKVKFMLTAITVFAVVGGALAFKAKKFSTNLYCTNNAGQPCNVIKPQVSTQGAVQVDNTFCTLTQFSAQPCAKIPIYFNQ